MRYIIKRGGTYTITTGITRGNLKTNVPVPKKRKRIDGKLALREVQRKLDLWWPEADEWLPTRKWQKNKKRERKR